MCTNPAKHDSTSEMIFKNYNLCSSTDKAKKENDFKRCVQGMLNGWVDLN